MTWAKGQSGNPSGRPINAKLTLTQLVLRNLNRRRSTVEKPARETEKAIHGIAREIVKQGLAGNPTLLRMIWILADKDAKSAAARPEKYETRSLRAKDAAALAELKSALGEQNDSGTAAREGDDNDEG